eukprot:6205785-Pleurochrysis_carterae.AAC.4
MRETSVSERRARTSGTIQIGACRLCKEMGEDSAPRSVGCSSMYCAHAEWAAASQELGGTPNDLVCLR